MLRATLTCLCVFVAGYGAVANAAERTVVSDIKSDEHVVFFRTSAWLDEARQEWHVPVHGWIYEPEDSAARKKLFAVILETEFDLSLTEATDANFTRRVNLMIADNERGKEIVVALGGRNYVLPPSEPNGHFRSTLKIPVSVVDEFSEEFVIRFSAVTRRGDSRNFVGEALLVEPTGLSIISDIDDTVKTSEVGDRKRLLERTFLLDFSAVPGMTELYAAWSQSGSSLHFVSSSPWQLYSPLDEFLIAEGFPKSVFSLKAVRFLDETLFDLFKSGTETKPAAIETILSAYPGRMFILVGDSGEHDPEVYAALLRKHPQQIQKVLIRNVTRESADNLRFSDLFAGIDDDCWHLFDDPLTLLPDE